MARNRNKEIRRVRVGDLRSNPANHRVHPDAQKAALGSILDEVGFVGTLLAYELSDGTLRLCDGHCRIELLDEDDEVEVAVVDLSPEERRKIHATYDAIGAMAQVDVAKLDALIADIQFDSPAIVAMLSEVSEKALAQPESLDEEDDSHLPNEADQPPPFQEPPERFQVVVQCMNEAQQSEVMELLEREGLKCRKLTT